MSELNLPQEFTFSPKELEGLSYGERLNLIAELLIALSEARDELHKKDCIIGDLLGENKRLRKENEICTCKKIKWNPK